MDELIDIVTEAGLPTGKTALKSEIHAKGYYHNTVHLWLYTPQGEILLAQRSLKKLICPGMWDVSVAGHVDAGETIENAILRETKEELSLDLTLGELLKIGVFPCFISYESGIKDNEFHHTYIAKLQVPLHQLKPQENEVEGLQLVSIATFKTLLNESETNNYFVASNRAYYLEILNAIQSQIG